MNFRFRTRLGGGLTLAALAAAVILTGRSGEAAQAAGGEGAVFTMTNAAAADGGNAVVAFRRNANGALEAAGTYPSGGAGTGQPRLGSQGSVTLNEKGNFLLVVNPGSDNVTVFRVAADATLTATDLEGSGGDMPESVTIHGDLVYVLNAGTPNNISGFRLDGAGQLTAIVGSTRSLSGVGVEPAQVQFSPGGDQLVVTEKATNKIDIYSVGRNGLADGPAVHDSNGMTPFGFAFTSKANFAVSEAMGGVSGQAATSSYSLNGREDFRVISPSVGDGGSEVCWVAVSNDSRYAYVTNFQSGTISSYSVARSGKLTLLEAVAARTSPGFAATDPLAAHLGPRDEAITRDGGILYVIDNASPKIIGYRIGDDGGLTRLTTTSGFPATFAGLAAR
ncbi:MAG: beta-propeller fold lactonase family protein [Tepidiformaceae bacterium]